MSKNEGIDPLTKEKVLKWDIVLKDIYATIVGDLKGNLGLLTRVKVLESSISELKSKIENIQVTVNNLVDPEKIAKLMEEFNEIKATVKNLEELKSEILDTQKKKWILYGALVAVPGVIGTVWAVVKYGIPIILQRWLERPPAP